MKKIHLISLGCSKNLIDSEHMLGLLESKGIRYQSEADGADAVIVNSCGFLQAAINESKETVLGLSKLKQQGRIKRIIVTGCMPQRLGKTAAEELPDVDLFLGTGNFMEVANYLEALEDEHDNSIPQRAQITDPDYLYDHDTPRKQATLGHTAYVKISEGCSRTCAFCIIPTLRGPMRSRSIESLVAECSQLASNGVREVNLVAQDLTAYGTDLESRPKLHDLLQELAKIEALKWIRLHYAYPYGFTDELIQLLANEPKVCSYVDMPLQHIDDNILKSMRRNTREQSVRQLIARLRKEVPGLTFRTTLIVGFPGETDTAFDKLYQFVEEAHFERLGVFQYSREPGTRAYDMPNQVPEKVKQRRFDRLMKLQQKLSLAKHETLISTNTDCLIDAQIQSMEKQTPYAYVGRVQAQAPEVDGKTVIHSKTLLSPGDMCRVRIEGATAYDFFARKI